MKSVPVTPGSGYRNEAVYRSAEELIAELSSLRKARLPRWFYFTSGLVLGLELAAVIWQRSSPSSPAQPLPPATSATSASADSPAAPYKSFAERDRELDWKLQRAYLRAFLTARPSLTTTLSDESGNPRYPRLLMLEGQLQPDGAPPLGIELELFPGRGTSVHGVVHYFNRDGQRLADFRGEGEISERTLTFRESVQTWPGQPVLPAGRTLDIRLPRDDAPPLVTGTWMVGLQHGTVDLKITW